MGMEVADQAAPSTTGGCRTNRGWCWPDDEEEELQICTVLLPREVGWSEEEEMMLLQDRGKVGFLQL